MGYDKKTWKRRIAERTDLSTQVVHLTREQTAGATKGTAEVLFDIVDQQRIVASPVHQAFIVGNISAVCFQDAPLGAICQNVFYEQKYKEQNEKAKVRYRAMGIAFAKDYAYGKGARPVVYDQTRVAKEYLSSDQWWRIVNFDLSDENNIIDWTHEREWRVPGDFTFDRSEVTLLFVNAGSYKAFQSLCKKKDKSYLEEVRGVVVMETLLY
ncbi:DUF2971 domain-containing protein [Achromobacter sp. SD115]|uniref:hypothetical protein n=1 Tax=Achromobacter sp. SD115 TaxID=2782011 RepID=UPI001A95D2FA|nr:hypothetical protein [Achromobacter sp. SD115]MBO1017965.1 DUF2971 domain-containing protein [Achromobacter sp. SD115]